MDQPDPLVGAVPKRFDGRVALVTGAGSDADDPGLASVGAATSRLLAREGCFVAVVNRNRAAADRVAALIRNEGGSAVAVYADVTIEDECAAAVQSALSVSGRLDVLINNVGIEGRSLAATDMVDEEWASVMDANAKGTMLMSKHAIGSIPSGGSIINLSTASVVRPGIATGAAYAASKGAINALTLILSVQLASRGIRVNGICPGSIWTPRIVKALRARNLEVQSARESRRKAAPLGTEGTAWDVAHAAAFLASDQARWITGQTLVVDGGATVVAAGMKGMRSEPS